MVSDKVVFVAGHFCSGSSIPASDIYKEAKILQITPASTNPKLTDDAATKGNTTVFRTCGRDDVQGATVGAYILKNNKGAKVAVRPTARASPTRPRRRSMPAASRRRCTKPTTTPTRTSPRSSTR